MNGQGVRQLVSNGQNMQQLPNTSATPQNFQPQYVQIPQQPAVQNQAPDEDDGELAGILSGGFLDLLDGDFGDTNPAPQQPSPPPQPAQPFLQSQAMTPQQAPQPQQKPVVTLNTMNRCGSLPMVSAASHPLLYNPATQPPPQSSAIQAPHSTQPASKPYSATTPMLLQPHPKDRSSHTQVPQFSRVMSNPAFVPISSLANNQPARPPAPLNPYIPTRSTPPQPPETPSGSRKPAPAPAAKPARTPAQKPISKPRKGKGIKYEHVQARVPRSIVQQLRQADQEVVFSVGINALDTARLYYAPDGTAVFLLMQDGSKVSDQLAQAALKSMDKTGKGNIDFMMGT